jgi:hypothetical protein
MTGRRGYARARESLRRDFGNRCAYCCIHEHEIGEENFEIDHFQPVERGGAINDYGNLYWACRRCNLHKSDHWPTEAMLEDGLRFADPCAEYEFPTHFAEDDDGILVPATPCGSYHIDTLRLNRMSRLERRRRRNALMSRLASAVELIASLPEDVANSPQRTLIYEMIVDMERQIAISISPLR